MKPANLKWHFETTHSQYKKNQTIFQDQIDRLGEG